MLAGPKHSTGVPFNAVVAVPLSVDEKEVALVVPNPVTPLAVKASLGLQLGEVDPCRRAHSLVPPTLQMVNPFLSPVTIHLKVKVSPGQVGRGAVNCPATSPEEKIHLSTYTTSILRNTLCTNSLA